MKSQNRSTSMNKGMSSSKPGLKKRVGDAIERLGDKVEHSGMKKLGDAIERIGDKIEHAGERRKKQH